MEPPARDIEMRRESPASRAARKLISALNDELLRLYPEDGTAEHFGLEPDEVVLGRGAFLVAYDGSVPLGCGAIRLIAADTAEIRRMYVAPIIRGQGLGRRVLEALEAEARAFGVTRIVLETGPRQPEAIALYARAGYSEIAPFGEHVSSPLSVFMGRDL